MLAQVASGAHDRAAGADTRDEGVGLQVRGSASCHQISGPVVS